jgi:hypothetical protein
MSEELTDEAGREQELKRRVGDAEDGSLTEFYWLIRLSARVTFDHYIGGVGR